MESFTAFGLGAALGLLVLFLTGGIRTVKKGIPYRAWILTAVFGIPLALIGSRLLYVLVSIKDYLALDILTPVFCVRDGGFSLLGGFAGIALGARLAALVSGAGTADLLDAVGIGFLPCTAIIRAFESGTGVGIGKFTAMFSENISNGLFTMENENGELVFAVYRMECALAILLFAALLIRLAVKKETEPGDILLWVMTVYGASQAALASLHNDYHMMIYFFQGNEILSLVLVLIALAVRTCRKKKAGEASGLWLYWVLFFAGAGLGVLGEFRLDRGEYKIPAYGLLLLGLAISAWSSFAAGRQKKKEPAAEG